MKYCKECSLEDFDAWSSGEDMLDFLRRHGLCKQVEETIGDLPTNPTDTDINDFRWFEDVRCFEDDCIARNLGYNNWEDMENELEGGEEQ